MKKLLCSTVFASLCFILMAQTPSSNSPAPSTAAKLPSTIFHWEKMQPTNTPSGVRRMVFDAPTTTLDKIHCHITTLNAGASVSDPVRHRQEEVIIIKEGTVEATVDGRTENAGPGSVIFFAANAVTRLRNVGDGPATYTVLSYYTPLAPKN